MKLAEDYTMSGRVVHEHAEYTLEQKINRIEEGIAYLCQRMNDCIPRRDFSKAVKRQLARVVREHHSGRCPCCHKVAIIDDNGSLIRGQAHFDHFKGREHNGLEDGWLICRQCNSRLENDDQFKQQRRRHFEVFHDHRREFCPSVVLRSRRRKPSATTTDQRQARLFE